MAKILGIDLGTTNSAMAIVEGGVPKILENTEGARTTPSMVAFSKTGERLVGLLAKRQAVTNPKNTIFSVKRLIGRKFSDIEVKRDKALLPYEIKESANGGVDVKINEKWYRPEEISAMILTKLKTDAEAKLGEKIEEAIITVPAYFDDAQRQATKAAGEIAGFSVRRILNEPTAAALAYGLNKKKNEKIVVYDYGGGTFDLSVLEIGDDTIEVRATGGDTHLGGDDFDQKIIQYIAVEFKKESGVDVTSDVLALQRLKETAEEAKHELSTTVETEINIPFITSDASGPRHLLMKFTRAKLEELVGDYLNRSFEITKKVVDDSGFKMQEIDEIVLVGGQTRMPAIVEGIKKLFGKEPNRTINPDEVVALGAAVQGGILQGDVKDVFILDGIPPSPRGLPQVEVSFDIDANGILSVKAKDKATNKEQSIRIEASTGLSKDEIEKMKCDAEAHADEDKKKKELVEAKNRADTLVYTAEKSLRDAVDKIEAGIKDEVNQKIEVLKKAKEGSDVAEIHNAETALAQSLSKIGEAMYKKPEDGKGPDIKDAEHKDV